MKKITLKGLATRWSKSEDEILNIATDGELSISLHLFGYLIEGEQRLDKLKNFGAAPYDEPEGAIQQAINETVDSWRTSQKIKFESHDGLVQMRAEDVFLFVGQEENVQLRYAQFNGQLYTMLNREYLIQSFSRKNLIVLEKDVLEYEGGTPPDLRNPEGSKFLEGRKDISAYWEKDWQTVKKYAEKGSWLRRTETGKPLTTTFEIDQYRLKTAT